MPFKETKRDAFYFASVIVTSNRGRNGNSQLSNVTTNSVDVSCRHRLRKSVIRNKTHVQPNTHVIAFEYIYAGIAYSYRYAMFKKHFESFD